jgi:hypothetical protein
MRRSSARGERTSAGVEILALTPHALWILVRGRELMLDFGRFPWFADASIAEVSDVSLRFDHHLYWRTLDVDLHVDSIEHPERYPLVSRPRVATPAARRRAESVVAAGRRRAASR